MKKRQRRSATEWGHLVAEQENSGLSAPLYCREHQLSYASFIAWKKKLRDEPDLAAPGSTAFVEITPAPAESHATETAINDTNALDYTRIELDLGTGIQLRISRP